MIERTVRIGRVPEQDAFRRADVLAMSPDDRLMHMIHLRDEQLGESSCRVLGSGVVSYRTVPCLPEKLSRD